MKIGILTFHRAINIGALLQAYALVEYLNGNFNCTAEIIDYRAESIEKSNAPFMIYGNSVKEYVKNIASSIVNYGDRKRLRNEYDKFMCDYIPHSVPCDGTTFEVISRDYDIIVVGSDQVWNPKIIKNEKVYYLPFKNVPYRKISYAASVGNVSNIDNSEFVNQFLPYIMEFEGRSVRELETADFLKKKMVDVYAHVDPTLLLNKKDYSVFLNSIKEENDKYVLVYRVLKPMNMYKQAEDYANSIGAKVICINASVSERRLYPNFKHIYNLRPDDFLRLLAGAECMFTTSFHCVALSIIFEKLFFVEIECENGRNSRAEDLLKKLGLLERDLSKFEATNNLCEVNWKSVKEELDIYKGESYYYFNNIIDKIAKRKN